MCENNISLKSAKNLIFQWGMTSCTRGGQVWDCCSIFERSCSILYFSKKWGRRTLASSESASNLKMFGLIIFNQRRPRIRLFWGPDLWYFGWKPCFLRNSFFFYVLRRNLLFLRFWRIFLRFRRNFFTFLTIFFWFFYVFDETFLQNFLFLAKLHLANFIWWNFIWWTSFGETTFGYANLF